MLLPKNTISNEKRAIRESPLQHIRENANLILRCFARRASFEATSAPANAKRTPIGVLFALYKDYEKDIFRELH